MFTLFGQTGVVDNPGFDRPVSLNLRLHHLAHLGQHLLVRPPRSTDMVKVHRPGRPVDCGIVVNPDTIAAQVEGGTMFGLTAALYGAITLKNGRVEQSNFIDYRPIRMYEAPRIETYIVKSAEAPGGFGEAPCAIVTPAVTNAIFATTGKR